MVQLDGTFIAADNEQKFEPLPAGDYRCKVIESKMIDWKEGGKALTFNFEVTGGQYNGRRLSLWMGWKLYAGYSGEADIVGMGKDRLAQLCKACGRENIRDTSDLHGREFIASVKLNKAGDNNDIAKMKSIAGQTTEATGATQSTSSGTWGSAE